MTRHDLKRLLEEKLGSGVSVTSNHDEWKMECPFCGGSSLAVNVNKRVFHCWKCEESGTLRRLLGRGIPKVDPETKRRKPPPRGYFPPGELHRLSDMSRESDVWLYLLGRGFDPIRLERLFGVSYCLHGAKYGGGIFDTTGTLVIPVEADGLSIAWQCRLLYNPEKVEDAMKPYMGWKYDTEKGKYITPPKYFTMPGFDKGLTFFNRDAASKFGFVVVTEGAFDAMSVGRCAIAAFGKGLSDEQVSALRGWKTVFLLLDPDAEKDQEKLELRILGRTSHHGGFCRSPGGTKVVQVKLKGYKDAGECPHDELVDQIAESAKSCGVDFSSLLESCPEDPFESGKLQP